MIKTNFVTGTTITSDFLNDIQESDNIEYTPAGAGAIATPVQDKLRESVSVFDFMTSAQIADVQAGTGSIDCYAAIIAAIDSVTTLGTYLGGPYRAGPALYFPPGVYYVSQTINIKKRISLLGDGSGLPYGDPCILKFPIDTTGIVIHTITSGGLTTSGDATLIRGLSIYSLGGTDTTKHGVWIRAHVAIENCYIENFPGDGYHVEATAGGGGTAEGNANGFKIIGGRVNDCGGSGLYVDGADANAGLVIGLDCSSNGGWGIWDSSFLGNTYIACHTAANTLGAYKTDSANARNIFIGCYSESGQPASEVVTPSQVIGGLHAADFTSGSDATFFDAGTGYAILRNTPLKVIKGFNFVDTVASGSVNELDRYLEGTWTPVPTGVTLASGAPDGATYEGYYTVIGNIVHFTMTITPSNTTTLAFTAGTTKITLPPLTPLVEAHAGYIFEDLFSTNAGKVETDGYWYPRNQAAYAGKVIVSGTYRIATA